MAGTSSTLREIIRFAEALEQGEIDAELDISSDDNLAALGQALQRLGRAIRSRHQELALLNDITASINSGVQLSEVLEKIFESFRDIIPYDRIGFALLEDDGQTVVSNWARSDAAAVQLGPGYSCPLAATSLGKILESRQPRILNDLAQYFSANPDSDSTKMILAEGMNSSLTCPLIVSDRPAGLLFFSSKEPGTYANVHVELFQQIAGQLSATVEKSRLVTDLVAQQKALETKNRELEDLNDLKSTFIGMASHDLRGPLVQVLWSCEMLFDKDSRIGIEDRRNMADLIQKSCEHMLSLIDDLLDVTLIETGKLVLEKSPTFLNDILFESVALHQHHADRKRISLTLNPTEGPAAMVDHRRLRQVVDNLVSNAVKYSNPDSEVTLYIERINRGWRVNVQDQGPGLTEEDKSKIFRDFQKLSARPTGGEKSSGLGLAIAKRIVAAHHGEIGVNSEHGKGAVFWFTIPDA